MKRSTAAAPLALHADFFALRAPLFPVRVLSEWSTGLRAPHASDADLEAALIADRALLLERLRAEVENPVFREAVFCASPSLDEALALWLRDPAHPRAARVTSILVRYLARMSARSTPFGLFASCGVGRVGAGETSLSMEVSEIVRRTRLDMQYLTDLVSALEREPELRAALRFWPSSGLYRIGDRLHHAEAELRGEPRVRAFRLVSVDAGGAVSLALEAAKSGARPDEIVSSLREADPGIGAAAARAFVDELIDSQILVSELAPPITGAKPIDHVIDVLSRCAPSHVARSALEKARAGIAAIDAKGIGQDRRLYDDVTQTLETLPAPVDRARLFQVDLARNVMASNLGSDVIASIEQGVALLRRIAAPTDSGDLAAFAAAFHARYETREIPLCEALDEETGIGFGRASSPPTDLLEGLSFEKEGAGGRVRWERRERWLATRVVELARAGSTRWELDEEDVAALETQGEVASPDSLSVVATIAAESDDALRRGDYQLQIHGSEGGVTMLGRFCHDDVELSQRVRKHLEREESLTPDTVFAEIVHQPEGRIGNILCRPVLRAYEIPYLASSGVDAAHRLPIDDLLVSVDEGRVRLRSRRLGRWVEPRMTNAHNPESISLGIYRFLCALRAPQADAFPEWHWGALRDLPHLPRVSRGRIILSLERWRLHERDLRALERLEGASRYRHLARLRERLGLPRWVALVDGDNVLPVDLDNVLSCESFVELVRERSSVVLTEVFPSEDRHVLVGPEGRHASEILVPFTVERPAARPQRLPVISTAQRSYGPGSEWLYAKIYAREATADALLREVIAPLTRSSAVGSWFFLRYADPDPHLRVRFKGDPQRLLSEVLPSLHRGVDPYLSAGRVDRFELATYRPEVERYGGDRSMPLAEAIFHADSEAALAIVEGFDGMNDAALRWRLALVGIDALLDDLGLDREARIALLRAVRAGYVDAHAIGSKLEREVGARFRLVRAELEAMVVAPRAELPSELAVGCSAIEQRSRRAGDAFAALRALAARGELGVSLEDLAASLIHMHANRMLSTNHWGEEWVLYDFLLRVHESQAARARRASPPGASS